LCSDEQILQGELLDHVNFQKKNMTVTLTSSVSDVGYSYAIGPGSSGTFTVGEIYDRVGSDERFILESWLDVKLSIFDEGIFISASSFLKLLVAATVVS
jgi:hypothetical protein